MFAARPLLHWRSEPEWFDTKTGKAVASPTESDKGRLQRRTTQLTFDDMVIIVPSFTGWRKVGGGFLPPLLKAVDDWLRRQRLGAKRLLRLLSSPTPRELVDGGAST